MSHANTNIIYPQSTDRNPTVWQVREDGDDYDNGSLSYPLLELHDRITDRLARAEALACLLQTADNPPDHATRVTAIVLQELIQQTQEANEKLWERIRQTRQDN